MKASVNTTSLNSNWPVIWPIGLTLMPGVFMSTRNWVRPWRRLSLVVGDMRRRGPDLGAVDEPAAVGPGRLGLGREQVGAGIRLAHADRKTNLAAADARQDVHLDVLGGVFQKHRAALPVGHEEAPRRHVGNAHLLGHHIALEKAPLMAAIFPGPGHAEPAP